MVTPNDRPPDCNPFCISSLWPSLPTGMNVQRSKISSRWRNEVKDLVRAERTHQLCQAQTRLTPTQEENRIFRDAKAYEAYMYFQSNSKDEYDEAYDRRLALLKQQESIIRQATTTQHAGMSYAQYGAAVQAVEGMERLLVSIRVRNAPLNGLSDDEKSDINELIERMLPMYQRVDQLLPVFLALTNNHEATKRLILMKYLFQDQLDARPRGVFVMTSENMRKLKEQFSRYFVWVKNQIIGQGPAAGQGPAQTPAANLAPAQAPSANATNTFSTIPSTGSAPISATGPASISAHISAPIPAPTSAQELV